MLCGSLPYNFGPCRDEASFKDSLLTVLEDDVIPIRQRDSAIPESLAATIEKAIAKDHDRRYSSAKAFKFALSQHIQEQP
jgi:serine/threonine protein kinase